MTRIEIGGTETYSDGLMAATIVYGISSITSLILFDSALVGFAVALGALLLSVYPTEAGRNPMEEHR